MNREEDALFQALAKVPLPAPDPARDGRIRSRCHARLRRRQQIGNLSRIAALAGLFLYLSAVLVESLQLSTLR